MGFGFWSRKKAVPAFSIRKDVDRPDIVVFVTDEQRYDQVGYASDGYYETPELDRLTARGVAFETAYSGSTVCVPARACLLTGLLHHRIEYAPNSLALKSGFWTVARALSAVGYETVLVGKMHFSPMYADHGFERMLLSEHLVPFSGYPEGDIDDYHRWLVWQGRADARATHMFGAAHDASEAEYVENCSAVTFPYDRSLHPVGWIAANAAETIRKRRSGAPLFLVVSFPRPHAPYDPPEPYASKYDLASARVPPDTFAKNESLPGPFRQAFQPGARLRLVPQRCSDIAERAQRRVHTNIRALVNQIDDAMGEVLSLLDPRQTVAFFTADHGHYGGHRGLIGKVPWIAFEDLARVPFACAAPGAREGLRVRAPVQSSDIALTCLDYAGIVAPSGVFDTVSLRPVIEGAEAPPDRAVYTGGLVVWPMVRKGPLKLIRHGGSGEEVLFDLERDPGESENVALEARYQGALSELRTLLDATFSRKVPELPVPGPGHDRRVHFSQMNG